jgi:hypothetical protein
MVRFLNDRNPISRDQGVGSKHFKVLELAFVTKREYNLVTIARFRELAGNQHKQCL